MIVDYYTNFKVSAFCLSINRKIYLILYCLCVYLEIINMNMNNPSLNWEIG